MMIWSAPSIRCMRGARWRNALSIRDVHRSGGSKTWESDDRIRAGSMHSATSRTARCQAPRVPQARTRGRVSVPRPEASGSPATMPHLLVARSGRRVGSRRPDMPNLFEEFRTIVAALGEASVPFAVCGSLAMSIHARPRATIDVDLLVPAEAIASLVAALLPLGYRRRESAPTRLAGGQVVMHRLTKIVTGDPDVMMVDVIEVQSGVTSQAWETRVTAHWEQGTVTVVSRQGLIALKRLRGSPQDAADIRSLEEER